MGYEDFYEVSNLGRVKSLPRKGVKGGILKPKPDKWGYLRVGLWKNGKEEKFLVHILVMQAFIGKCPDGHEVDHYDWNPSNNRLDNLSYQPKEANRARHSPEWHRKNVEKNKKLAQDQNWQKNHAEATKKRSQDQEWQKNVREGAKKRAADPEWRKNHAEGCRKAFCKPVDQFTLDGQFVNRWPSATDAARELGLNRGNISTCCNRNREKAGGFKWRYADT